MVPCYLFSSKKPDVMSHFLRRSASAPLQKLSVTGNLIGHSGALLLLLQDAGLFVSSSLDSALLRTAFCSVLLIQMFRRDSHCGRIWRIQKGSGPRYVSLAGHSAWNAYKKHFTWTLFLWYKAMLKCKCHSPEARYWITHYSAINTYSQNYIRILIRLQAIWS